VLGCLESGHEVGHVQCPNDIYASPTQSILHISINLESHERIIRKLHHLQSVQGCSRVSLSKFSGNQRRDYSLVLSLATSFERGRQRNEKLAQIDLSNECSPSIHGFRQ